MWAAQSGAAAGGGAVLPPAVVLPIAAGAVALLAWHIAAVAKRTRPASRRRIRLANGVLMVAVTVLFSVGVSVVDSTRNPRVWALVWLTVIALVWMCIVLAAMDVANTMRLAMRQRRALRAALARPRSGGEGGESGGIDGG